MSSSPASGPSTWEPAAAGRDRRPGGKIDRLRKENRLPTFLDHHPVAHAATAEIALEALQAQIRAGGEDDFGVKYSGLGRFELPTS